MILSFVSDIHLNLRTNKEWEQNRFLNLFSSLSKNDSDTILLGGDIFDLPKPSLEEIDTFYRGVSLLKNKTVYIISGNHENLSDTKTVFDYLPQVGFTYVENSLLQLKGYDLYLNSHIKCKQILDLKKNLSSSRKNILFSHFRANYGTFIKGEVDTQEISRMFDYVFAGDIHHKYSPFPNIFYPSSPYGVHYEPLRDYGYYRLSLKETFEFTWERLHLPSKILIETISDKLEELELKDEHRYRVIIKGPANSKVSSKLMKDIRVATFDFKPEELVEGEEFEKLVDDLSTHLEEDVLETLLSLLKTTDYILTDDIEKYLRAVLLNARA